MLPKQLPLQWLAWEIPKHLLSGAILNLEKSLVHTVLHIEVPDVNVVGSLPTAFLPILFQEDSTHVVLVYLCLVGIPLLLEEIGRLL